MLKTSRNQFILLALAGYVFPALTWISMSDQILSAFTGQNAEMMVWFSTLKGACFVLATAVMLFFALRTVPSAESAQRKFLPDISGTDKDLPNQSDKARRIELLHQALERDEFVLYYQPQVDLIDGKITGAGNSCAARLSGNRCAICAG